MKKSFLFFLTTFLLCCTKDKFIQTNLTFTGVVLDYTTGVPVGNATVNMAITNDKSYVRPVPTYHTVTDLHGNYSFSIPLTDEQDYKIIPGKTGYAFADTKISWTRLLNGKVAYVDTVYLDVASFLQINFHNNNISSLNDTLNISVEFGNDSLHMTNRQWNHNAIINYNNSLQFFDSTSYKLNCFARVTSNLNFSTFQDLSDTTVRLIKFGTKPVDIYY